MRVVCLTSAVLLLACGSDVDVEDDSSTGGTGGACPCAASDVADAATEVGIAAGQLVGDVARACAAIATELGQSGVPDVATEVTNDELRLACDLARAGIGASGPATVVVGWGGCAVDHARQGDCELTMSAGACNESPLDRCRPEDIALNCLGTCTECTWDGTAPVPCGGTCDGVCYGMCSGSCSPTNAAGECEGACSGACNGTCAGVCESVIPCSQWCTGQCDASYTVTACASGIRPSILCTDAPPCMALCEVRGLAGVTCATPAVAVETMSAAFESTLSKHLPTVLRANRTCPYLIEATQKALGALPTTEACADELSTFETVLRVAESMLADGCEAGASVQSSFGP